MVLSSSGSWDKTEKALKEMLGNGIFDFFDHYGRIGVDALSRATPIETGDTAHSWEYTITHEPGRDVVAWYNTHRVEDVNIAVIIQYGHGTGTGGYVEGRDYINPAIQPVFDKMVDEMWKAVRDA
jgi:hypothetical protein